MFPNINHACENPLSGLIERFPSYSGAVEPDSFRNFLGVRTRCKYLPAGYTSYAGTVQPLPQGIWGDGLHDIAEWAGVLKSVVEARKQFVCIELGAGWGPWVVSSATAARQRGISDVRLVAVEASRANIEFVHQHFKDNALNPSEHEIIWSVCGSPGGFDGVPHFSLLDALKRLPDIDLIHFDIQGAEVDVIRSSIETIDRNVRRVVIGTHGRDIDAKLLALMSHHGWRLENEKVSTLNEKLELIQDGTQVWVNPGRVHPPQPYSADRYVIHNSALCEAVGVSLRVITPDQSWSYAVEMSLRDQGLPPDHGLTIEISARVWHNPVCFGVLKPDGSAFIQEIEVAPNSKAKSVELIIPANTPVGSLIVRTARSRSGEVQFEILSCEIVR